MKAVIGVVLALMLAVGIYISLTNDAAQPTLVASPELKPLTPSGTAEQVKQSPTESTASGDSKVAPEPTPSAKIPDELAAIAELSGQELMSELMKYSGDVQSTVENVLLLIEAGLISVDERLFEFGGNRALTPMGMAVMLTQGNLTVEHFDRFLAAGAELYRDDMNSTFIAMVDQPEVMSVWYKELGYGPEDHKEMLSGGLVMGNAALTEMIMQEKNGELDQLEFEEFPVKMVMAQLKSLESVSREKLVENLGNAEEGTEQIAADMAIARLQNNLDQIEILRRYGNLDDEQRANLDAAYENAQNAIDIVTDIVANIDS
ncbi:hypothetical protein CWE22_08660 [Pseudidiomarina aestuarii]|uniref:Uncharacterized protein n=1 Tax=Pseudidiomarina aestuarii TaxID=624146 RepID=A0A7Z6ZVQ3_9GAMM|nr:hypothetical protein [Pseudidiomarina aestuarii]RUO42200.1 hypothetical protein CWE22_08660 [Pseudidiomarina aestuarii]